MSSTSAPDASSPMLPSCCARGRIASVGAAPAPAGVRILDLGGKHPLPGLIESRSTAWNSAVVVE
ncbi:MAG: hypothetical protein DMG07_18740 [Acidobacteria bacterium]|nr:MAG: hypothetical protein DMG07_18740 [Acidobacteriota bacterium]